MTLPLADGDIVDGYVVERVVGTGGMAVVAVASHRTERHRVAIKMMLPAVARRSEAVQRFEREARTLAQLHSEHTLRIYGSGKHGTLPYMLLEYLNGKDLSETLKADGPMEISRAVECILQACHAIAEAHMLGIVHRDLKPGNLFLTRRSDGSPCIKVLDFGISKVTQSASDLEEPSLVTKTTAIMGSPFYMSPEQMLSSRNVDARTDVWALGVVLYELLTKTLPFAAETVQAVCGRILADAPTPLRKLRPQYPQGLEEVIARCLMRKPDQRFANIADFATRLEEFGPPHTRFAIEAISELVRPSEPAAQAHLMEAAAPESGGTTDTTLYVPTGKNNMSGLGWAASSAALAATFGVGVGIGWLVNAPTDPTQAAAFGATATRAPTTSAREPTARSSDAAPRQLEAGSSSTPGLPTSDAAANAEGNGPEAPAGPAIDLDAERTARGSESPHRASGAKPRRPAADAATSHTPPTPTANASAGPAAPTAVVPQGARAPKVAPTAAPAVPPAGHIVF